MAEFVPIKTEFMKGAIVYIMIVVTACLTNSYALMWYTKDLSPLGEITVGVIGWATLVLGAYAWKAKWDHQMGYRQGYYKGGMSVEDVIKMTSNSEEE